ncbi:MAG: gamma carbonic anhydrase family protein [Lachnospiraceae bacterium]|nr:gamma carbonic anhydrase family protein [Lachnospiraceae bacterium]
MEKKSELVFIADGAKIIGDVTLNEGVSVWYNAVLRGDDHPIVIGKNTNIQDGAVLHVGMGHSCLIGENVSIGHGAIVHGCSVSDNTVIGMGAIIMNGAKVGKNCIIGAGALVTEGMEIPDNTVAIGAPAKKQRPITKDELEHNIWNSFHYVELAFKSE